MSIYVAHNLFFLAARNVLIFFSTKPDLKIYNQHFLKQSQYCAYAGTIYSKSNGDLSLSF